MMCDHTVEERGAAFEELVPLIPTIGNIYSKQNGKCACGNYLKSFEAIPNNGKLICLICYHTAVKQ